jgi:hypothetical protein
VSEHLRKTESKAAEQRRKRVEADREKKRQEKKLNYLITRTELYSHFMSNRVNKSDPAANVVCTPLHSLGPLLPRLSLPLVLGSVSTSDPSSC